MPRFHLLVLTAFALGATACGDPTGPDARLPDVRQWVTGEAAQNLDDRGNFQLPTPVAPGSFSITSSSEAARLAHAYVQTVTDPSVIVLPGGQSFASSVEAEHGAAIDFRRLRVAPRVYYGASAYEPVPDSVPSYVRKYLGPFYLVHLLSGRSVAISVASSAYNTDLWIQDGRVYAPPISGGEFRSTGVPKGAGYVLPISPEHAVEVAARATGARITKVPELILPHRRFAAYHARWKLTLDRTVAVRGRSTGDIYYTEEVYVGPWRDDGRSAVMFAALLIPQPVQPAADTLIYGVPAQTVEEPREYRELVIRLRPDVPVLFESVDPA